MSGKRNLVIGDIHSGLKALQQVLQRAEVSVDDTLIFLGDYVDGWSEAVETIDFLIALRQKHKCIYIRGNHDELCLAWLEGGTHSPLWVQHGGAATMASYEKADEQTIERHKAFYRNLENYHLDNESRLFLHAGFTNLKGIDYEYLKKTFYWDRTLWELATAMDTSLQREDNRYPERLRHYKEIYIGHTPLTKFGMAEPTKAANVWNIDTGAAFKGPLSILDITSKKIWQSDPVHTLYPKEKGRN